MNGRTTDSDRGLTPVVGIVLLVAITLLLASTVAAFAFGLEEEQGANRVPTTAFGIEYDHVDGGHDTLSVVHQSGNPVTTAKLVIDLEGASCSGGDDPNGRYNVETDFSMSGQLSAGDTIRIDGTTAVTCSGPQTLNLRRATVQVVWVPETGASSVLRTWSGPG